MPDRSVRRDIYDRLAEILATTREDQTALRIFQIMRLLAPKGHLFAVIPKSAWLKSNDVDVRDQVYHDLDAGVPFTRIAQQMRLDWRLVKQYKADWDKCTLSSKDRYRASWRAESKAQPDIIELGRAEANIRRLKD